MKQPEPDHLPAEPAGRASHGWSLPRPQATIRGRLIGLLLLAATPVVVIALAGTFSDYNASVHQARDALTVQRDLLNRRVAARLDLADTALNLLGAIPSVDAACRTLAATTLPPGLTLRLAQGDGFACSAGEVLDRVPAATVLRDLVIDRGVATLTRVVEGRRLSADVTLPMPPPGLSAWIVDEDGRAWAVAPDGPAAPQAWRPETGTATDDEGGALLLAEAPITDTVSLLVAQPAAEAQDAALLSALQRLGEILALLALSIGAVMLGSGYAVTRPLVQLRRIVTQWRQRGGTLEAPDRRGMPDEIRDLAESFVAGAEALAARETDLKAARERAEILASEVHHRVKNNLQIVSSLLALQAQRVTDPAARTEFEAARDRIGAIATLHRHMYTHHDPEAIDLGAFIEELGVQLFAAVGDRPGRRIQLDVSAPALRISSDQAVPLALIITEAVSAALKQGFPPSRGGRITIRVEADDRRANLAISDDGVTPRSDDQLRAMLLRGLARQLGGELKRQEAGLTLDFPLRSPLPRPPPSVRPPPAPERGSPR
ncbi:sensor histidine kinase [Roseomonas stagni]|uniref:histidine kinase n=1 Tax=Falsiroseomonas algicola TaxID=2716930 RepID=A0A6M1LII5_9PROT|nr:sensor histidine kinase [Falsiroseomonas algicola]NGM19997.1 sensor histidine kinase [Falsiroseomonas algicola]